jgi:zinc and cadmium transporter
MYGRLPGSPMPPVVQALLATLFVSAIALIGIVFFFREWNDRLSIGSLSFAAGVLLATAFLELLPEAVESGAGASIFTAALAAMIGFFLLERLIRGFHVHEDGHAVTSRYLILVGDGLHNFIDGVAIGASFLASPALGVATTLAIAVHEVPQEIADYGILVSGGFARRTALLLNFLSGLTAVVGAALCFVAEGFVLTHLAWFMAATAGMFIYIAGSDLIPELHHARLRANWMATIPFLVGVLLMGLLRVAMPHAH